jgi:hypothetical protein
MNDQRENETYVRIIVSPPVLSLHHYLSVVGGNNSRSASAEKMQTGMATGIASTAGVRRFDEGIKLE